MFHYYCTSHSRLPKNKQCFALSSVWFCYLHLICTKCTNKGKVSRLVPDISSQELRGSQLWAVCWALLGSMTTCQFTEDHTGRSRSTYQCQGPSASPYAAGSASTSSISAVRLGFCLHWRPPLPRSAEGRTVHLTFCWVPLWLHSLYFQQFYQSCFYNVAYLAWQKPRQAQLHGFCLKTGLLKKCMGNESSPQKKESCIIFFK